MRDDSNCTHPDAGLTAESPNSKHSTCPHSVQAPNSLMTCTLQYMSGRVRMTSPPVTAVHNVEAGLTLQRRLLTLLAHRSFYQINDLACRRRNGQRICVVQDCGILGFARYLETDELINLGVYGLSATHPHTSCSPVGGIFLFFGLPGDACIWYPMCFFWASSITLSRHVLQTLKQSHYKGQSTTHQRIRFLAAPYTWGTTSLEYSRRNQGMGFSETEA